ncbi:hypothetical protein GCM10025876_16170 [Demequina litorisediminis]|uniref:Uncharacterized protein n=1 Tax=Demequina litorisediminis TaxID=1849022 RepID=A0ABQ6IE87_9MICO|nr:hypothetical protein GCM10025876_16170 [Demequina litorisediminis]
MSRSLKGIVAFAAVGAFALAGCSSERSGDEESTSSATASTESTASAEGGTCIDEGATIGVALPQKTSENWVLAEQPVQRRTHRGWVQPHRPVRQRRSYRAAEPDPRDGGAGRSGGRRGCRRRIAGWAARLETAKDQGATVIAYDRLVKNTDAVDAYIAFDNFRVGEPAG